MNVAALTADSHAILMLRSALALPADGAGLQPLDHGEWSRLAAALKASAWRRPGALLGKPPALIATELDYAIPDCERFAALLARHAQITIELDRLVALGIRALTRVEPDYPERFKARLGTRAPSVLFVAGSLDLLDGPTLAVTGSRDLDREGTAFARALGERCAVGGVTVISGGARGADREAMNAALAVEGRAVGVLADGLERQAAEREAAALIQEGRLALISPFLPSAPFEAAQAHGRNRLIYCLGDVAVVVASDVNRGGTWSGATEALRERWAPLFVRDGPETSPGNAALLQRGALPFGPELLEEDDLHAALLMRVPPADAVHQPDVALDQQPAEAPRNLDVNEGERKQTRRATAKRSGRQPQPGGGEPSDSLSDGIRTENEAVVAVPERSVAGQGPESAAGQHDLPERETGATPEQPATRMEAPECAPEAPPVDLFEVAWPLIAAYLRRPHPVRDVAVAFGLEPGQAQRWLRRAAEQGLAELVGKTSGYRAVTADRPATVQPALL